jgi:hypothetical protein
LAQHASHRFRRGLAAAGNGLPGGGLGAAAERDQAGDGRVSDLSSDLSSVAIEPLMCATLGSFRQIRDGEDGGFEGRSQSRPDTDYTGQIGT